MRIQTTKKGDQRCTFVLKDANYRMANALRRAIMIYIPSMAVDRVTIYENTSTLYDEVLVKRLSMTPLTTDLKTYSIKEGCKCGGKGCGRCEVSLILEKSGPGMVYAEDLKSRDPKVKAVNGKTPIVKLGNNQKVKMEMVARLGTMAQHAKYQCSLASYEQTGEGEFRFFVESYNNLKVRDIVELALKQMEDNIDSLQEALKRSKKPRKVAEKKKGKTKKKKAKKK